MSKEILTITPVYNNANLLNEMLCSLVCQSYKNFDIVALKIYHQLLNLLKIH